MLRQQLNIAIRLGGRAVSVHCVQATGSLLDVLRSLPEVWTPSPATADSRPVQGDERGPGIARLRVALHSFTGSAEFVRSLLALERKRDAKARKWAKQKARRPRHNQSQQVVDGSGGGGGGAGFGTGPVPVAFEFYFGFSMSVNGARCGCCGLGHSTALTAAPAAAGIGETAPKPSGRRKNKSLRKLEAVIAAIPHERLLLETDRGACGPELEEDLRKLCEVRALVVAVCLSLIHI